MDKPVTILGGGLIGTLLAIRIRQSMPHLQVQLFEAESHLPIKPHIVTEAEIAKHHLFLAPFICASWKGCLSRTPHSERYHPQETHLVLSKKIEQKARSLLGNKLKLNNNLSPELALPESSFVLDARGVVYHKSKGYRRTCYYLLELKNPHHLVVPVIYDSLQESTSTLYRAYYPIQENIILVKEVIYQLNNRWSESEIAGFFRDKGWSVQRVLRHEVYTEELPLEHPFIPEQGKLINLAGFYDYVTGCELKAGLDLIEDMVRTSFRFGELKEIVRAHRRRHSSDSDFKLLINQSLMKPKASTLLDTINDHQDLTWIDKSLITLNGWLNFRQSSSFQHYPVT